MHHLKHLDGILSTTDQSEPGTHGSEIYNILDLNLNAMGKFELRR